MSELQALWTAATIYFYLISASFPFLMVVFLIVGLGLLVFGLGNLL